MEIGILTSSRADYGFYRPLIKKLNQVENINAGFIVFGTHLSMKHGYTIKQIKNDGYKIFKKIKTNLNGDLPKDISETIGLVHQQFANYWATSKVQLIICLGDRYEMYAAVSASVPFNITVIHISGGEETLGTTDNYFRHALTLMAKYHFTNTKKNAERVAQIINSKKNIFHTGSLSIDNINETRLISITDFQSKFKFDISSPFILFTFHPETVDYKKNKEYSKIIFNVLVKQKTNILVTMPNADTMGQTIRDGLHLAANRSKNIHLLESLGSAGYYTALKYCDFVMGNSSSGIVEAASFGKYVLNMGSRQKGREQGENVINVDMNEKDILNQISKIYIQRSKSRRFQNIYGDGKAAINMLKVISNIKVE